MVKQVETVHIPLGMHPTYNLKVKIAEAQRKHMVKFIEHGHWSVPWFLLSQNSDTLLYCTPMPVLPWYVHFQANEMLRRAQCAFRDIAHGLNTTIAWEVTPVPLTPGTPHVHLDSRGAIDDPWKK